MCEFFSTEKRLNCYHGDTEKSEGKDFFATMKRPMKIPHKVYLLCMVRAMD